MKRREFITLLGAAGWPLAARAQAKVYAIGILETVPRAQNQANFAALLDGLRELGYLEGKNLRIDYRSADGQGERFPELAAELVRNRVDLIVTRGTPVARAAKAATVTIPIVMAAIGEPLGVGVVASLARPGGNVTGLSAFVTELFRQAGTYASRILKGEKPADLPILQATKFEFVVNLQTAEALGLEVPGTLLAIANEVIE